MPGNDRVNICKSNEDGTKESKSEITCFLLFHLFLTRVFLIQRRDSDWQKSETLVVRFHLMKRD